MLGRFDYDRVFRMITLTVEMPESCRINESGSLIMFVHLTQRESLGESHETR